jgi:hypothetical protein
VLTAKTVNFIFFASAAFLSMDRQTTQPIEYEQNVLLTVRAFVAVECRMCCTDAARLVLVVGERGTGKGN